MLFAAAVFAIVTQDQTALRASPRSTASKNAVLWQGEALEVRGGRAGYLQVWDYRRERGGYVLEGQVRQYPVESTRAGSLLENVRLLLDMPGWEALGIGHAALFLKIASPPEIGSEIFDALGTMADRLSRRASSLSGRPGDDSLAGHLDVAQGYGLRFVTLEQQDRTRLCYDGEAFKRVLPLQPTAEQQARAVLGLTRPECVAGTATERHAFHEWAAATLEQVPLDPLPAALRDRVRMRRVATWASLVFERAREGKKLEAQAACTKALTNLALVSSADLSEPDADTYTDAAVRAAVARLPAEVGAPPQARLSIEAATKATGETCLTLVDRRNNSPVTLVERCTFGVVWPASVRVAPRAKALAIAVQPLEDWRELWLFHEVEGAWTVDVLAPAGESGLGYIEWAGWTPDGTRLLAARETRVAGRLSRSFELLRLDTLAIERKAGRPADLTAFHRWQSPDWRSQTMALR